MLINFSFENFRSFRDNKTLSMEAGSIKELEDSVFEQDGFRLLPVAVMYGANSSGKSNVLFAISEMKRVIIESVRLNPNDTINQEPFVLDENSKNKPTSFEAQFLLNHTLYRYGFEHDRTHICAEWLYEKKIEPRAKEHYLFIREEEKFNVSKTYFKEGIGKESATSMNRLFISLVAQLKGETAQNILKFFGTYNLLSGLDSTAYEGYTLQMFKDKLEGYQEALDFFHSLDLGFNNLIVKEINTMDEDVIDRINKAPETTRQRMIESFKNGKLVNTLTTHNIYNDKGDIIKEGVFDNYEMESNGTQKMIELSGPVFDSLLKGRLLLVDELDAKLHPMLTRSIVKLFMDKKTNPHGAQLIFTTHDTHLLDKQYLRRDQIWFTEKDKTESSDLYSLMEFKVRNDLKIEKNYIEGRYGAIPFISNFNSHGTTNE